MTFRGDDDARDERLTSLEKQLEESRRELSVLRPKAVRLDIAEKENKRLIAQLSRPAGPVPSSATGTGSMRGVVVLFVLVGLLVGCLAAGGLLATRSRGGEAAYMAQAREEELARRELALLAREADLQRREADLGAAVAVAPPFAPPMPPPIAPPVPVYPTDPVPFVDRTVDFAPIIRAARVAEVSGAAPVARRDHCRVTLTAEQGDCRADVTCGDESLYPRTGSGGFFHCQVEDHVVHTGHDANPTPSSGDPRLLLDADAREITISDGPPDWSVRLTYNAQ